MKAILFVDEDHAFLEALQHELQADYQVYIASDAASALKLLESKTIDICVLDFYLGPCDGKALFLEIRNRIPDLPCILFTGRADKKLAIEALNLGVDSMLEKPFSLEELRGHIAKFCTSRNGFEGLQLQEATFSVRVGESRVVLTPIEFRILQMLWSRRNQLVHREEICAKLWGRLKVTDHTFDTHFSNMKRKIPQLRDQIQLVRGKGYVLHI